MQVSYETVWLDVSDLEAGECVRQVVDCGRQRRTEAGPLAVERAVLRAVARAERRVVQPAS